MLSSRAVGFAAGRDRRGFRMSQLPLYDHTCTASLERVV